MEGGEEGFSLIELLIVVVIIPIVVGAITVALLSVFTLQSKTSNRLTDSGDAQVVASHFQDDVEAAASLTTYVTPTGPAPCGSGSQVLGVQLGNGNEISYAVTQENTSTAANSTTYSLFRNECSGGVETQSQVVAHDLPASAVPPSPPNLPANPPITVTCGSVNNACVPQSGGGYAYQYGWVSTVGITAVTFGVTEPGSSYPISLEAVPIATSNSTDLGSPTSQSPGVFFAPTSPVSPLSTTLGFVNFAQWNTQTASAGTSPCTGGAIFMSAPIAETPYAMSFCISVSAVQPGGHGGTPITGTTVNCANQYNSTAYNDITAVPLPTYTSPPTSEAFLGNNGFYTVPAVDSNGNPVDPALYECDEGSDATITITNIEVVDSAGVPATNWDLVTGDAESTDPNESISWTSNQPLNLIANSTNSEVGNACNSTPPGYNATYLTGIGTTTVTCTATQSTDKTGTVMLKAIAPTSLAVTLDGSGLQAMFLGILLP
jgi:prepilin-type N-terminal cleavage/methylation domain-containing protein